MKNLEVHQVWMEQAIALAKDAGAAGEIPVGAVIVNSLGEAIATGVNRKERDQDPTAHAEIVAIREAARVLKDWHLNGCTLYVTLEPCPMCAGAILQARVSTLVYGADDPKAGAIQHFALKTNPRHFGTGLLKRDKSLKVFLGKLFTTLPLNHHKSLLDKPCSYSSLL